MTVKDHIEKRLFCLIVSVVVDVATLTAYLLFDKIISIMYVIAPFCILYKAFGVKCAVCGGTHCIKAMMEGSFAQALSYNAFVCVALTIIALMVVLFNICAVFKVERLRALLCRMCSLRFFIIMSVAAMAFALSRIVYEIVAQ